jgi:purine nucleosidase
MKSQQHKYLNVVSNTAEHNKTNTEQIISRKRQFHLIKITMKKTCLFLSIFLTAFGQFTATAQARKVIIDCDAGVDDATALILAMNYSRFEILGITTVFGNAYLDQTTKNALTVVELSKRNIPVYKGAAKPLRKTLDPPPDFIHGNDGLGNTNQPNPQISFQAKPAAQFIVDIAKAYPGDVTIIAVGRLTNLAEAIKIDSNVTKNIKEVVLMGGDLHVPGNVNPVAEANIEGDPDAADIVFTAPWKVTMIGLDVTTKVKLNDDILLRVKNKNKQYGPFLFAITRFYLQFYKISNHLTGGFYVHDPSAVMYLIDSTLFKLVKGPVRVVTDGIAIGQTIMPAYDYQLQLAPWKDKPFVNAAVGVDTERFLKLFESVIDQRSEVKKN